MKKYAFKKHVFKKICESSLDYLESIKLRHSKVKNIQYRKLEIAPYLKDSGVPIIYKQLIFRLRTSMINVKENFKTMYGDTSCNLGGCNQPQTQQHLLSCSAIIEDCMEARNSPHVKYTDLFSSVDRQHRCAQLYAKILETKELLEEAETV